MDSCVTTPELSWARLALDRDAPWVLYRLSLYNQMEITCKNGKRFYCTITAYQNTYQERNILINDYKFESDGGRVIRLDDFLSIRPSLRYNSVLINALKLVGGCSDVKHPEVLPRALRMIIQQDDPTFSDAQKLIAYLEHHE